MTSSIRPAVTADAGAVASVVDAAYRGYISRIGKAPGPMLDDYPARIAAGQVWVLEAGGVPSGVLVLEESEDGFVLDNIAVTPERHGQGLGRALPMFAEQEAVRREWREIRLYTHVLMVENISLYKRILYVETGRRTEKGFDRVYMAKFLTAGL